MSACVALGFVVLTSGIASAACPSKATSIDPPEFEECLKEWDSGNKVPDGLAPEELAKVKNLEWFEQLMTAAEKHKNETPATKVDIVSLRGPMTVLLRKMRDEAFDKYACGAERTWCLDRDGAAFDAREVTPELFPGDRLIVVVLSHHEADRGRIAISSRSIASVPTLLPSVGAPAGGVAPATAFVEVTRLEFVVPTGAARLEISVLRAADAGGTDASTKRYTLAIQRRRHVIELGVALPFALDRRVNGTGAVSYGIEPELAFAITYFPGTRITDEALQPRRSWVGFVLAADVTRALSEKRYYAGVDVAPINGLSLITGLAIMPWAYVPSPESVDDVLMADIEPDRRYHLSFFFGIRVTADFFRTTKAVYEGLQKDL